MYKRFYGLKSIPFSLNPDPDFLFMSEKHRHALTYLQYALMERMPITVILGRVGTGKTTLLRYLLKRLETERTRTALIIQPNLKPDEFLHLIASEYELCVNTDQKSKLYSALWNFFVQEHMEKRRVFLLIDEAQNLSIETLEEVRMLTNIATEKDPLLQIVMLGQPGLREKLMLPEMEQFLQRVAVSYELTPLSLEETRSYIAHRLKVSGREKQDIFTEEAINEIYDQSQGVPRLINIFCDSCLVYGFGENLKKIDKDAVNNVLITRQKTGIFIHPDKKIKPDDKRIEQDDISTRLQNIEGTLLNLINKLDALEKDIKNIIDVRGSQKGIGNQNPEKIRHGITSRR